MDNQITLLSANQIQPNGWLNESHIEINQSNKITSEDPIKRSAIRSESVEMDSEQVDGNDGGGRNCMKMKRWKPANCQRLVLELLATFLCHHCFK